MEKAVEAGYRPGAVATTDDGSEVVLFSYPYTDGEEMRVLGLMKPGDPASWKEFGLDELILRESQRTPVTSDE